MKVQEMAKENLKNDIEQVLKDLKLKFRPDYETKYIDIEKCHKLGELMASEMYSNPDSIFHENYNS